MSSHKSPHGSKPIAKYIYVLGLCYHFISNNGIQSILTRSRYQEILQSLHFADNSKQDQTYKGSKIHPIIDHLNKSFGES